VFDVSLDECRGSVLETRTGVRSNIRSISSQEATMTALTIHRPTADAGRSLLPAPRRSSEARRPGSPPLALVPAPAPDCAPARVRAHAAVHLTARGKIVVLVALVAVGVALMLALSGLVGGAAAGTPAQPTTHTIVVQPGQTLWSIARDVAPAADRRETIARIIQLNALPSSGVSAGERLVVPAR
jgi:LysM repeat protein